MVHTHLLPVRTSSYVNSTSNLKQNNKHTSVIPVRVDTTLHAITTIVLKRTFENSSMQMTHSRSTSRTIAPHPAPPTAIPVPAPLQNPCSPGVPLRGEALCEGVPVPPLPSLSRGDESDVAGDDDPRNWLLLLRSVAVCWPSPLLESFGPERREVSFIWARKVRCYTEWLCQNGDLNRAIKETRLGLRLPVCT